VTQQGAAKNDPTPKMPLLGNAYKFLCQILWACFHCLADFSALTRRFLPRDATQSAVMSQYVVCPSVCLFVRPSVTFRYRDHIGWNTSKIISRLINARANNIGELVRREHPKMIELIGSRIRAFDCCQNQ